MARFFPTAKISQIHGQAKVVNGRLVVAMYHPAAALHQQSLRQTLVRRLSRMAIPAALSAATRLAAEGKLATSKRQKDEDKPPEQLSLF